MKLALVCTLAATLLPAAAAEEKILIYTRNHVTNGKGYVHDNIAASVAALKKMGTEKGFEADVSDDPQVFTDANLKRYQAIVFANSNNEAFDNDAQREAFQRYIRAGGGFVGIHSATGSERKWPWYWQMIGGTFARHPKMQTFLVRVQDANHPATRGLPATFEWTDECYYHKEMATDLKILLVTDPAKLDDPKKAEYPGDRFGDALPLAWYHTFEGGRSFYTALGHKIEHYSDPRLYQHILGGVLWAMGETK
jgi:type 1 glutamine amidotransferase